MEIKQLADFVNVATKEVLGETGIVQEDLSNLVDIGKAIFNANAKDAYVKALVNHIGKVIFVNRSYQGGSPRVLRDAWDYGSVLEKIRSEIPEAVENESWNLQNGASYDPNIFKAPIVSSKFFNTKTTFEIDISVTDKQVRQSFSNATQLDSFISMLFNDVEKSITIKNDALVDRTIANFIGATIYDEYQGGSVTASSGARAVNLLYLYKQLHPTTTLTATTCLTDLDFLRFASREIGMYVKRLQKASKVFNISKTTKFTPRDLMHVVMHTEFAESIKTYLESPTYHNELVKLPLYEEVSYWQGSGTGFQASDTMKIDVKTADEHVVQQGGIIGVIFDRDALGVTNFDRDTTSNYNAKGRFTNYFNFVDAAYFNDYDENFVVFFVA